MKIVIRRKADDALVGTAYECNGCGGISPVRKDGRLPVQHGRPWVERDDPQYSAAGRRVGRRSVVNYYCPTCVGQGVTAATVAATTVKLTRRVPARG